MIKACILSIAKTELSQAEKVLLSAQNPWGVILMGRSCRSREQVKQLVDDIHQATGRETLIFIDQEGGRVARLKSPEWPIFPTGEAYSDLYLKDQAVGREAIALGHKLIGAELAALGIYADCAPVVDVHVPGAHDIIGDRALGQTAEQVSDLARAALDGLQQAGVVGVIKHIPGHGRSMVDSHEEMPVVTAGIDELETDFAAFRGVNDALMAMTAHIAYDALDKGVPATHSKTVIQDTIRGRIGFDGLIMSDDLGMAALGGTLASRGERAISAGCDILLHCSGFVKDAGQIHAEMQEVAEASPVLAGEALRRAEAVEAVAGKGEETDIPSERARFDAMMGQKEVQV